MRTTIELTGSDFTQEAFERIQTFLRNKEKAVVKISILDDTSFPPKDTRAEYFNRLETFIKQADEGKVVSFTWDEFEAYSKQMFIEP